MRQRRAILRSSPAGEREAAHEDAEVAPIIGAPHCGQNRAGVEEREIARVAVVHREVLQKWLWLVVEQMV